MGCMQILNTMFKLMKEAKGTEYTKDDIFIMGTSQKKLDIEKSRVYLGYKLLWYLF